MDPFPIAGTAHPKVAIRSLKPNLGRQEALALLDPRGIVGFLARASRGPLRLLADAYVPFRLFRVEAICVSSRKNFLLAVDAVTGQLDPYRFAAPPEADDLLEIETRNCPDPLLDDRPAGEIAANKVRRLLFSSGFFRLRNFSVRTEPAGLLVHIPYWLGFFGAGDRAHLCVVDAVRKQVEGAKARRFFCEWLISAQDSAGLPVTHGLTTSEFTAKR